MAKIRGSYSKGGVTPTGKSYYAEKDSSGRKMTQVLAKGQSWESASPKGTVKTTSKKGAKPAKFKAHIDPQYGEVHRTKKISGRQPPQNKLGYLKREPNPERERKDWSERPKAKKK